MPILPNSFRFSPTITLIAIVLAAVMLRASAWQWDRYNFKKELESTYALHSDSVPLEFPASAKSKDDFSEVMNRKVSLDGTYDYDHQMLIRNRRHASGPGFWLITPFHIKDSDKSVLVSRGFIPFEDGRDERWKKYNFESTEKLIAVVQPTVPLKTAISPDNPDASLNAPFITHWLYVDVEKMVQQLPYPVIPLVFLQRVGSPKSGDFPAEAISINVPSSTHFGYTIEWIILALLTILIAGWLQAFPRRRSSDRNLVTRSTDAVEVTNNE